MKPFLIVVLLAVLIAACGGASGASPEVTLADLPSTAAPSTTATTTTSTPATTTTTTAAAAQEPNEFGAPTFTGDPLPFLEDADDPAIGLVAPEITGTDFAGNPVSIEHDGTAKAIVFLAHWCPHCQEELPEVVEVLEAGEIEGVEIIAVATGTDAARPNFPPSEWFAAEEWPAGVIVDDDGFSVLRAFGGPAFPFWTFVTGDGQVALRIAGRVDGGTLVSLLEQLAAL